MYRERLKHDAGGEGCLYCPHTRAQHAKIFTGEHWCFAKECPCNGFRRGGKYQNKNTPLSLKVLPINVEALFRALRPHQVQDYS